MTDSVIQKRFVHDLIELNTAPQVYLVPSCGSFQMLGGYGDFMYQTGMIDELQRQYVIKQTDLGVTLIQQQKWVEAFQVHLHLLPDLYQGCLCGVGASRG